MYAAALRAEQHAVSWAENRAWAVCVRGAEVFLRVCVCVFAYTEPHSVSRLEEMSHPSQTTPTSHLSLSLSLPLIRAHGWKRWKACWRAERSFRACSCILFKTKKDLPCSRGWSYPSLFVLRFMIIVFQIYIYWFSLADAGDGRFSHKCWGAALWLESNVCNEKSQYESGDGFS